MDNEALAKKRQKAAQYADEPERFSVCAIKIEMQSEHGIRTLFYVGGQWKCDCPFFKEWQTCSHAMAVEQLPMLQSLPMKYPLGSLVGTSEHKKEV
jgi:hypothetical protein